jgi:hypothetical protein
LEVKFIKLWGLPKTGHPERFLFCWWWWWWHFETRSPSVAQVDLELMMLSLSNVGITEVHQHAWLSPGVVTVRLVYAEPPAIYQ